MSRKLFWKLCLIIATGVVALFYVIGLLTSRTEEGMSLLAVEDRQTLTAWGKEAQALYLAGDEKKLALWLANLQREENTWAAVASYDVKHLAGGDLGDKFSQGYNLGRNVEWKVHLYFAANPTMEVPFTDQQVSFLIRLPERMRPGVYWRHTELTFQIILPTILLALLSFILYRHIMKPLLQLQLATRRFSKGKFDVRAKALMGERNDEFSDLAGAFDQMAVRIGEQIISQRQLIADLSHELRTPLTRLDIALGAVKERGEDENIERIDRESSHIRKLVEDTLTLAWLENEQPELQQESLELIDLLDVLIDDAKFEFPDREMVTQLPDSALVENSSHRAAGQALENILRNALRYTPSGKVVHVILTDLGDVFQIDILDQGPGVPDQFLSAIFKPFFRLDSSRGAEGSSFGLGLALAQRQLAAIRSSVTAQNRGEGEGSGLCMTIKIPKV
ncbi:sensor histidine kinase [Shewanella woodyi]|uniref:histidine kinase n=1 Tax=Shewanella woodyi (strain ATCC 51908 / MS32) TaxID=392500 RepID=B1KFK2_SHEWM|nr:histidine kinase sensor domain-containing protein [Shewanella woodyi]ACA88177.1 integral membrane sensor signal transduction histidine kinase [Shewanella woodyi ATCC 51908]